MGVRVRIAAPVQTTEDTDRVRQACTAWWPDAEVDAADGHVVAEAADLDSFRARVWELRIIDAVRGHLLRGADGATLRFRLDKQAAFAGRVSFPATPHPLGDLEVTVEVDDGDQWADGEALAWWVCPPTKDGHIVDEPAA